MSSEQLRDQIADLFPPKVFLAHRDNIADAVMTVVGPLLDGLSAPHFTPYADEEHTGGYCYEHLLALVAEKTRTERERDLLVWLHAEAVHEKTVAYRLLETVNQAANKAVDEARGHLTEALAEVHWLRREVEFEANGERWANAIVGRGGHGYVNGGRACSCGESCLTIGDWERHLIASGVAEGKPLCSCLTAEQAAQLPPGFSRPVCTVHPEGGAA